MDIQNNIHNINRTNRLRVLIRTVPGQFVAGQLVADNQSRTIRREQFVAK